MSEATPQTSRARIIEIAERLFFQQGFRGTSLNDVMTAANLSKGAFFHHFKNKEELAFTVLERWADNDDRLVQDLAGRATILSEDPLQKTLIFIKLFEEWLAGLHEPLGGCLFASFTYESAHFDASMHQHIKDRLKIWMGLFESIFEELVAACEPRVPGVSSSTLAETLATLFEGGLLLGRALDDKHYLVRQLQQFRQYLVLVFGK